MKRNEEKEDMRLVLSFFFAHFLACLQAREVKLAFIAAPPEDYADDLKAALARWVCFYIIIIKKIKK